MKARLLSTGEAAKICAVTPDTILKWIRSGRLRSRKTAGGHNRIDQADLVGFFSPNEIGSSQMNTTERTSFRYCWEYNGKGKLLDGCRNCVVYEMRAQRCYEVVERAKEIGHNKLFCQQSCQECEYFKVVHQRPASVLIVTDDDALAMNIISRASSVDFNLETTSCEYTTSAIVETFRPDYVVVDCSLGDQPTRDICNHLIADPRIPFVRLVLAAERGEFPAGCDREIYARIDKPFGIRDVAECVRGGG